MIAGLLAAGCRMDTRPRDISNFSTNRAAPMEDVTPFNGTYSLYGDDSDTAVGPLLMKRVLKQGEAIGFEFDDNHVPFAVAGSQRMQLNPGRYRWQMEVTPGEVDWEKTNTLVVEVVIASVAVGAGVIVTIIGINGKL
jgi:hypothetical protein